MVWSNDDIEYLRRNYHKQKIKDIAAHLGRKPETVYCKMTRLGIVKNCHKKKRTTKHPDGAIVLFKNYRHFYYRIKIQGHWVSYAKHIWEKANGPIPEGFVISYRDGNSMNVDMRNLVPTPLNKLKRKRYRKSFITKVLNNEI